MGYKSWKIPQVTEHPDRALEKAGYTPLLSAVLRARGLDTSEKAARFLRRDEGLLHDPMLLRDMDKAVARITQAARKREKLAVYGDYDVDGASSACLLLDYFRGRGLDCEAYIPDRLDEGYGLNAGAIDTLHEKNVSLLITVDCGITAISEAEHAKSLGMDMIITDHHECPQRLPAAMAVIDPKRPDSDYPFTELAGVSVAFQLVCALEKNSAGPLSRYADLIAAGTIADVVPLIGENRCLAHRGLEKLKNDPLPGLAALLEEA
ncbi:MAG: DHH family phosphoesterase, partial [Oscillospiraceae bacterium]|nr:DHH family phosphoesterase [Oscillospiraceae bacterium]